MHLAVVIPTRNRSDLATRAIASVLPQLPRGSLIMVSDNSSDEYHASALHNYVAGLDREDVRYLRPSRDLAMPAHWDWASSHVESMAEITHATVLTDRMIFKRGAIRRLDDLVDEDPSAVLSYNHDVVDDYSVPVRLRCQAWTGRTLAVTSDRLLELSAGMEHHPALPRMLNSVVPATHLQRMRELFGTVFDSVAPDFCFAYRTLSLVDSVRYLDESLLVHGSLARSNGASYARGQRSADHADFMAKLGGIPLAHAAPVPGLDTVANAVVSEYELVRRQSGLARFVPVDMDAYFTKIEAEIAEIADPSVSRRQRALLRECRGDTPAPAAPVWRSLLQKVPSPRPRDVLSGAFAAALSLRPSKAVWAWLGARPPRTRWFHFQSPQEAFEFAQSPGRRPTRTHPRLQILCAKN